MKTKLIILLIITGLLLFDSAFAENTGSKIHITDAMGRDIVLDKPAERIAFSSYYLAEAIKIIGAWDKVVGRDGYISDPNMYPNLDAIPAISDSNGGSQLDYEKILEIKPDVMIMPMRNGVSSLDAQDVINNLEPEIPVVFVDVTDPDTFNENLKNLGLITGNEEKTEKYLDFYNSVINGITEKTSQISEDEKPNIFIKAAGYTAEQFCTKGKGFDLWHKLCSIAGGNSISSDLDSPLVEVDPEWIIDQDVDVIVSECWDRLYPEAFGYYATDPNGKKNHAEKIIDDIASIEVLSKSDAVKNNQIYLLHDPLMNTPRFVIGAAYLAKWLHPELFQDLNPEEIHEKYLDFLGADYDLDAVGYAGYP